MTLGIMLFDMHKLRRFTERGHLPVQLPQPLMKRGIAAPDVADVALEVLDVDRVEADDGGVEPDVGFGDVCAEVVWACGAGEVCFRLIEVFEERPDVVFVGFLRALRKVSCCARKG